MIDEGVRMIEIIGESVLKRFDENVGKHMNGQERRREDKTQL